MAMANQHKFLSELGRQHLVSCISILFGHDEDLLRFFFSHKEAVLRRSPRSLVMDAMERPISDQLLIRVALDYWNRRGGTRLEDLLAAWGHDHWLQFLHSMVRLQEAEPEFIDRIEKWSARP